MNRFKANANVYVWVRVFVSYNKIYSLLHFFFNQFWRYSRTVLVRYMYCEPIVLGPQTTDYRHCMYFWNAYSKRNIICVMVPSVLFQHQSLPYWFVIIWHLRHILVHFAYLFCVLRFIPSFICCLFALYVSRCQLNK